MITRVPLRLLAFALPLLVVTLAALVAAVALFQALGDTLAANALLRCAVVLGVAVLVNVVLLAGTLGLRAVQEDEQR